MPRADSRDARRAGEGKDYQESRHWFFQQAGDVGRETIDRSPGKIVAGRQGPAHALLDASLVIVQIVLVRALYALRVCLLVAGGPLAR